MYNFLIPYTPNLSYACAHVQHTCEALRVMRSKLYAAENAYASHSPESDIQLLVNASKEKSLELESNVGHLISIANETKIKLELRIDEEIKLREEAEVRKKFIYDFFLICKMILYVYVCVYECFLTF